jgi:F-type H+-transporting ATPase subunit b
MRHVSPLPLLLVALSSLMLTLSPRFPVRGAEDASHAEAAHDSAHGDATDLGHNDGGGQGENPVEFRSDLALWTFVVFLLLLALLAKFAWGPIVAGLDRREQGIADKIEEARRSADEAALRLTEYEARLVAAGDQARQILLEARQDAEAAKDRILAEAQQAAEASRQRAVRDIAAATSVAIEQITERSVDLAHQMAARMLRRELQPQDRAQLIKEALEQIPNRN